LEAFVKYVKVPAPLFAKLLRLFSDGKPPQDDTRLNEFCRLYEADETSRIPFGEFFEEFQAWLSPSERKAWSKIRVSRVLPLPSRNCTANKKFILARKNEVAQ
jgi:hypothetical protein